MTQPIGELTDRMRDIFGLVVEAYLERGLPIGSKALAGSISLSPASIRNVMQELEERGLLTHPHTSAGRIPTESGLRLFVDGIMQAAAPNPTERREIERQIVRDQPIEDALAAASAALSGLSHAAGVVLAPKREPTLKQLNFVPLSETRALAVLVGADGSVENRIVSLDGGTSAAALTEGSNFVNARLSGLTLAEAEGRLRAEIRERKEAIDAAAAELVAAGLAVCARPDARIIAVTPVNEVVAAFFARARVVADLIARQARGRRHGVRQLVKCSRRIGVQRGVLQAGLDRREERGAGGRRHARRREQRQCRQAAASRGHSISARRSVSVVRA
jgi:heat shock gene repressor HrcA